jgi:ribonuclease HII
VEEIDHLNILQATLLAMRRAVAGLRLKPTKVLVDGNRLPRWTCWPRPSSRAMPRCRRSRRRPSWPRCTATAGAPRYDEQYPQYGFAAHKGYGTAAHMAALRAHGACPEHRRSFAPVAEVLAESSSSGELFGLP